MSNQVDGEVAAMGAIAAALDKLKEDAEGIKRVLRWAVERYAPGDIGFARSSSGGGGGKQQKTDSGEGGQKTGDFAEISELFEAAKPRTEWEKAVVAGQWIMTGEGKSDFAGAEANAHLKHLGHGIGNITDALNKAIRKKPALVIQTAKSGSARQARKKYKITREGVKAVQAMINGTHAESSDE